MTPKFTIFAIAGGTASGKTTLAKDLCSCAIEFGLSAACISLDNFYKKIDLPIEDRRVINFDHPDSFDFDLLRTFLDDLSENRVAKMPTYDFKTHSRTDVVVEVTKPNLLIVEGILTLHLPELRDLFSYSIFVDTPDEIRLNRKLVRDVAERNRTESYALNQWHTYSQPMFLKYCLPSSKYADLIFSGMSWQLKDIQNILLDYYSMYCHIRPSTVEFC
jgi:uridine kinase